MTAASTGITKIKKICNLGIFSNFLWSGISPELSFRKINLVYGCNGSGKTTLSNAIGLFSEDHNESEIKQIEQGLSVDQSKPLEIEIEWDGDIVKHPTTRKKLYVFNSSFVANHVYDGTQTKVKNFKQVVTKEQLSNPALKKILETISAETSKLHDADGYHKKLEKLFNDLKKDLSKTWNQNIDGKRMPSLDFESILTNASQDSEAKIQKHLEEEFSKFKTSKDQEMLEKAMNDLNQIGAISVNLPKNMADIIRKSISRNARERVQTKIDHLNAYTLNHSKSIQNWFDDGATILRKTKDSGKCPLCDSALPDVEDLLTSYDAYFNDELVTLMREIDNIIISIDGMLAESVNKSTQTMRVQTLLAEYKYQDMGVVCGKVQELGFGDFHH
jgi:wobble nucleotide-excising tRNase